MMTRMGGSPVATLADSADALMVARRAKNWLFLLVMLALLFQVGFFFAVRYKPDLAAASRSGASDAVPVSQPGTSIESMAALFQYITALADFVGVVSSVVLSFVLLLLVNIMLASRIIGVAKVTSAYVWSLLLVVLLFPWQAFLSGDYFFKIPGVLYTWSELLDPLKGADFATHDPWASVLRWSRFVAFPLATVVVLLIVQVKGTRGLRLALGEVEAQPMPGEPDA